ncbi:MAG TPA: hypothetical protein VJC18_11835, partial [bacterium]|nr:hypothetical protein [bacterium]
GSYSYIEVPDGASKTFHVQFNAWVFGTQTIYITITADIEGYIRLPMRAIVTGPSSFKLIPTSYACTNDSAPQISSLDFYKVAYGQTRTEGIKLCNTGGEDIKITSATIENAGDALNSVAMDDNAFEDFLWQVSSEIDSTFALGESPSTTGSFVEPVFVDYTGPVDDPAGSYSVRLDHNDGPVKDVLVEAGNILRIDVDYVPTLDVEAGEGQLYYAIAMNAVLSLNTSLGAVQIPLLGATSGAEPMLEMSYRLSDTDEWKNIDLYSEGAALYFGTVDIFLDWVSINSSTAQVKIKNTGSGSKDLEFYGGGINGFFEYFWEGDKKLSFPMSLSSGAEAELSLRYLPSATGEIDDDYQARFDFGQFYFQHTGGNGPQGKATLVGEQDAGYAVELYYGGTKLEREYSEGRNQNLCVFSTDTANPTPSTF